MSMPEEKMFDPNEMQSIVDRLKAEGRMPSPEKLRQAMAESWTAYQEAVRKARAKSAPSSRNKT
jgi:hypothetical protein